MIQMSGRSEKDLGETNRMMIKEDLLQAARVPKSQQNKKNKRKSQFEDLQIFDKDFNVESMENPTAYLPRYNQEYANEKSCVQMCLSCFGNLEICFAHLCACCGCMNFTYQLPSSSAGLVQEFGKFNRLLKPGFNLLNPCSQEVHEVDLKIRIMPTQVTSVITKDNVELKIAPIVAFRVVNPVIVHYVLGDTVNKAIGEAVISSFRAVVGQNLLENVLRDRLVIVKEVKQRSISIVPHGLKIQQIFIENITIPKEIERDLSSLARERRLAEAMLIQNKANVETASLLKQTAQLLDTKAAMQIRYLQLIESLQYNPTVLLMDIGVDKKGFKQ